MTPPRHTPSRWRYRASRIVTLFSALGLLIGACTVTTDDEPTAVGPIFNDLQEPTTTVATTTLPNVPTRLVDVYMLEPVDGSVELVVIQREVAVGAAPQQILSTLFETRLESDDPDEAGLVTAIPQSAELLSAELEPNTSNLIVDSRGLVGSGGTQGNALQRAAAQIVFTATTIDEVSSVTFRDEGSPVEILIGSGEVVQRAVGRNDYNEFR